jgi:uncharacterized protein
MGYQMALITGASSGIGSGFARSLPTETGMLLAGRDEERLRGLAAELSAAGRRIDTVAGDLATEAGREALIDRAEQADIDLLIVNAGVGWYGNFLDGSREHERMTIAVNMLAPIEILHALVPGMLRRAHQQERRAGVILVASVAAFGPCPGLALYGATKAFGLRFAETFASELADQPIDVLGLCPTYTRTAFFARAGMPEPDWAIEPETVAREALAALGRYQVYLSGPELHPQAIRHLTTFHPLLVPWHWPRHLATSLRGWARARAHRLAP